jgi:hypothetical protein
MTDHASDILVARLLSAFSTLRTIADLPNPRERFKAVAAASTLEITASFGDLNGPYNDLVRVEIRRARAKSPEDVNGFTIRIMSTSGDPNSRSFLDAYSFVVAARRLLATLDFDYVRVAERIAGIAAGPHQHWDPSLDLPAAFAGLEGPVPISELTVPYVPRRRPQR